MTDQFTRDRSAKLVVLYRHYRAALDALPLEGRFMPYRWWTFSEPLHVAFMAYSQMLGEYATELANIINDLTHNVQRLRAWASVVEGLSDEDKLEASHEFIDMLGTVALGQPYAIKSRFTFAVGHLSHQANQARNVKGWKDHFPDKNLYLNDIEPAGAPWKKYRAFKLKLEPLAGTAFKDATDDFRNVYNHGFSSRFLIGKTATVTRKVRNGRVSYGFGGNEPLGIIEVADLLTIERDHCYRAFEKFQALIEEQIHTIAACDTDLKRAQHDT
ncbi:hypothetical protein ASD50_21250 [Mesorhizobium sp. Root552]|uniref:hypothetical protein n=1 Tax=Mesorhizobium sp. Root552 TaxID=1736555 RepID=UPI0006F55046|nr:hypothetical protein [Mesorhizobium sp. Root552]KQZ22435.1 hypothetical protein ASD50_21250 [Mesorhizobium sp. Root552]